MSVERFYKTITIQSNLTVLQNISTKATFLYCCPDCPSFPGNAIQMSQAISNMGSSEEKHPQYPDIWCFFVLFFPQDTLCILDCDKVAQTEVQLGFVFLYCCPDCPSCKASCAIWASIKKYSFTFCRQGYTRLHYPPSGTLMIFWWYSDMIFWHSVE